MKFSLLFVFFVQFQYFNWHLGFNFLGFMPKGSAVCVHFIDHVRRPETHYDPRGLAFFALLQTLHPKPGTAQMPI